MQKISFFRNSPQQRILLPKIQVLWNATSFLWCCSYFWLHCGSALKMRALQPSETSETSRVTSFTSTQKYAYGPRTP